MFDFLVKAWFEKREKRTKSAFLSVCELLSSYVLKTFPLLESQVVKAVDKLLTEIEQERVISDFMHI